MSSLRTEGLSVRSIFTFALVVVVTAFLWATFGSTTSVSAADAGWNGNALRYQGSPEQFQKIGTAEAGESHNIPAGSAYYMRQEKVGAHSSDQYKAFVIYFAPGADPPQETTATYVTYDYNSRTKVFSNPSSPIAITVDAQSASDAVAQCTIDGLEGMGWIVCPVSKWLAVGMDSIFGVLAGFMEVQPISVGDNTSGLYIAWDIMRNFANVAFIIVFIIIIYSQLTSQGLSNYGLKKVLPRLIIGAILVNLSYVVCALAVDISNILGYAMQDLFMQIRNQVLQTSSMNWSDSMTSWQSMVEFILTGGAAGLAAGIALNSAAASSGPSIGLLFIVLPALVGLLLAIITVILVLAARQAIITIFIVIAPLAIVAYLLPNTEKWFSKWREVLTTMLIFFPAFSVVFGGSQLAGAIIIQNANSINVVILGMIVQIAPLVITPLLLKFSGNLLGKIAGMVNNPNKGLIDRTRKWSDGKREYHRLRAVGNLKLNGDVRKNGRFWWLTNPNRYHAQSTDLRRRRLESRTKNATTAADNVFHGSKRYEKIHKTAFGLDLDKERIELSHTKHLHDEVNNPDSGLHERFMGTEKAKHSADVAKAGTTRMVERYKDGQTNSRSAKMAAVAQQMAADTARLASESRGAVAAQNAQKVSVAKIYRQEEATGRYDLLNIAGNNDEVGIQRALADALNVITKNSKEAVDNALTVIDYNNLTDDEKADLMNGIDTKGIKATVDMIKAATQSLISAGSPKVIDEALKKVNYNNLGLSDEDRVDLYANLGETIGASKMRPGYFDFGRIAKMKQGLDMNGDPISSAFGESGFEDVIIASINKGGLSVEALQGMFPPYIDSMVSAVRNKQKDITAGGRAELKNTLAILLDEKRPGYDKLTGEQKGKFVTLQRLL